MHVVGAVTVVLGAVTSFALEADVRGVNLDVVGLILIASGVVAMLASMIARTRRRPLAYSSVGAQGYANTAGHAQALGIQADAAQLGPLWPTGTLIERFYALPRMLQAAREGDYLSLPRRYPMLWLLSVIYVLSPIDVIPELLPLIGAADDAGVLVWLLTSVMSETGRFLSWERSRTMIASRSKHTAPSAQ